MDLKKFIRMQQHRQADKKRLRQKKRGGLSVIKLASPWGERERKMGQGNIWGANDWKISRIDERQEFTNTESMAYAKKDEFEEIHI